MKAKTRNERFSEAERRALERKLRFLLEEKDRRYPFLGNIMRVTWFN
jgi:hypothetical protein